MIVFGIAWWRDRAERKRRRLAGSILSLMQDGQERSAALISAILMIGSVSKLYRALGSLEGDGLLSARWDEHPYPRRRLYRITEAAQSTKVLRAL